MNAQPSSTHKRSTLYRIELDDVSTSAIPVDAPPPSGPALDAPPMFRIDHPLYEHENRAEWLADELLQPGSIFHGRVHVANDSSGKKKARPKAGTVHLTYATFKGVVGQMLHQSAHVESVCLPDELVAEAIRQGPNSLSHQKVEQGGLLLARLFLHYWRAVATAYPDAWDDPHEHLLWHPHGLNALARLGALVLQDQVAAYDIRQHYFDDVLERIAGSVSLAKSDHADVPARGMSDHLFQLLSAARHDVSTRRPGLMAVPGRVSDIDWGSGPAPLSPSVTSIGSVASVPLGPEN